MAIIKVIEIHSEGKTIEKATEAALEEATKTVKNINQIYLQDLKAIVENNKIVSYRVNAKVSFFVKG
jgi:flavin-binding protein dodecin